MPWIIKVWFASSEVAPYKNGACRRGRFASKLKGLGVDIRWFAHTARLIKICFKDGMWNCRLICPGESIIAILNMSLTGSYYLSTMNITFQRRLIGLYDDGEDSVFFASHLEFAS